MQPRAAAVLVVIELERFRFAGLEDDRRRDRTAAALVYPVIDDESSVYVELYSVVGER